MNLENWQRRELIGATYSNAIVTRYYGYSREPNPADTDAEFSIRKVTVSGSVESVTWNDNSFTSFNAKWSERAANFTAPTGALGFTYSGTNPIVFTWTRLAGVNIYDIEVRHSDGRLADSQGGLHYSSYDRTQTARYINQTTHTQRFDTAGQYNIYLQARNAAGTLTATHSYTL